MDQIEVTGTRYKVTFPGHLSTIYYVDKPTPEGAITYVSMSKEIRPHLKRPEESNGVYLERMIADGAEAQEWPQPMPELSTQVAIDTLFAVLRETPRTENGRYLFNWKKAQEALGKRITDEKEYKDSIAYLESLPQPEQLELFQQSIVQAFVKTADRDHPGAAAAANWKVTHKMRFMTIDQIYDEIGDNPVDISIKLDGELVAIYLHDKKVVTITTKGTIRSEFPATEEATRLLEKYDGALFVGEMYVVNDSGTPVSYMKAASILRDPELGQDHLIRLSVFDLLQLNGKDYGGEPLETRVGLINEIFGKGKNAHAATYFMKENMKKASEIWDQLQDKGWEGLIIYMGTQLYKVKPIMSYDMAVVAIEKSPKYVDRIGALLCSFIDKESRFRLNGAVGGGFTDAEKVELLEWANRNKVWEDEERIWVDPFKEPIVVEVEAVEVNIKERPKLKFKEGKWAEIEDDMAGVLRFPHFKRFRDDKSPKHDDVPIEQLPIMQESAAVLAPGKGIRVITGQTGRIKQLVPRSGDSGEDFDIIVAWDEPLWGEIAVSEVHPSEIAVVYD
jgi:ATP-dependent DNA ligase